MLAEFWKFLQRLEMKVGFDVVVEAYRRGDALVFMFKWKAVQYRYAIPKVDLAMLKNDDLAFHELVEAAREAYYTRYPGARPSNTGLLEGNSSSSFDPSAYIKRD